MHTNQDMTQQSSVLRFDLKTGLWLRLMLQPASQTQDKSSTVATFIKSDLINDVDT